MPEIDPDPEQVALTGLEDSPPRYQEAREVPRGQWFIGPCWTCDGHVLIHPDHRQAIIAGAVGPPICGMCRAMSGLEGR